MSCKGVLQPSPGPNQPLELQASTMRLLGPCSNVIQTCASAFAHVHFRVDFIDLSYPEESTERRIPS